MYFGQQLSLAFIIINKMSVNVKSKNNKQQDELDNLVTEIVLYLDSDDNQSLEYLLEGQSDEKIEKIRQRLKPKHVKLFDSILARVKSAQKQQLYEQPEEKQIVKPMLEGDNNSSDSQYGNFEKEYKLTDILYAENYSYPFLSLLQKMSLVYFYKSHPNPFPQTSLKMLHSLIETLFTHVFDNEVKENYLKRSHKHKKAFNNFLKEYLFFVFEKEYQKFTTFHKLFKSIKSSMSKKEQITEDDLNLEKQKSLHHPLISTQNLEELEYFQKISVSIKSETQFKEFTKIKSLNFLYFGEKRLKELIDPTGKFLAQNIQKQIMQLVSFILCRFVRKVILGCIRKKTNGKLCEIQQNEQIQSVEVKIVGNQIIDKYHKKVEDYLKLDEPMQESAKRTFIREFYEYEYENFIPKNVVETSQSIILKEQNSFLSLPETIWTHNRQYQILWTQRLAGEEYIREQYNETPLKRQKARQNDYSRFIQQHFKQFQENSALLWIKYLTLGNKVMTESNQAQIVQQKQQGKRGKEEGLRTRKKIKLQSLSS